MVKGSSLSTEYFLNDNAFFNKATIKVTPDLKYTLAHRSSSNGVAVGLTGRDWELYHDLQRKDTFVKVKRHIGQSTLTVKQHVPGGKWALVPSPVFELSRGGLIGEHSKLVASYDSLNRVGRLEKKLYAGDSREHKAHVKLSTAGGHSAAIRSKLRAGPLLHSAGAAVSSDGGLRLSAKSKFEDGTKVRTSYGLKTEVLTVTAKHTARQLGGGGTKATLTLGMDIPVKRQQDPRIKFGIKWDL